MLTKLFYYLLGAIIMVYSNSIILSITLPQALPASITSRTLSLKAGSLMQENSAKKHKRDLSTYDKAGPYALKLSLAARTRNSMLSALREFIWDHWHNRKRGHVVTTFYSKEGEPITYSFFIEPDEKGSWHVTVEIDRLLTGRGGSKKKYSETDKFAAYTVERIEVGGNYETIRTIPNDVTREPQSYKLRLIDEKGKVRTEV